MNTKFLAVALAAVAGAAFADSTSVTTDYVLGVLPVEMKAGQADIFLNIPWIEPGTNDTATSGVAVTNLVKTAGLSEGDTLRWYNGTEYKGWAVNGDGQWVAAPIVTVNKKTEAVASDTPELMRGQALILTRRSNANVATNVYLIGQTASSTVTSTLTKDQYTLIAPPAVSASADTYLITKLNGVAAANDVITFVNGEGESVSYYYFDNKWWHDYIDGDDVFHSDEVSTITLPVGTGMYYLRRGNNATITW